MYEIKATINLFPLIFNVLKMMLEAGAMEIRDVDEGEEPFLYASGWKGMGYILVKALVSQPFFQSFPLLLATKVAAVAPRTTFVAGNLTGGVIPGWLISYYLEKLLGHPVHFMYVSGTRSYEEASKRPITVINKTILEKNAQHISSFVARHIGESIDFVAGGAPGGMVFGHRISEILSLYFGRHVPFVYVRDIKKAGGHGEMITGTQNNSFFQPGMTGLAIGSRPEGRDDGTEHVKNVLKEAGFKTVTYHNAGSDNQFSAFQQDFFEGMTRTLSHQDELLNPNEAEGLVAEELTNFTHSTRISARVLEREYGFHVPCAACILSYDHANANAELHAEGLDLIHLFTLKDLLWVARQIDSHPGKLIKGYRLQLANTVKWNEQRGFKQKKEGGTL